MIRTGSANLASVEASLARAGCRVRVTQEADEVLSASRVVLPGVGAFGPAMSELRRTGLDDAIITRVRAGGPMLAICLGLQLLCAASEESAEVSGLGVIPSRVTRFGDGVRCPQLGWNRVTPSQEPGILHLGYAYFANSYRLAEAPAGWKASWSSHGGPFVAALERNRILACQFHPELSGAWGQQLIARWIANADQEVPEC